MSLERLRFERIKEMYGGLLGGCLSLISLVLVVMILLVRVMVLLLLVVLVVVDIRY